MDFDQVTVNGVSSNAFCGHGISDKNISKNPVKALDSFIFTGYNEQACNRNAVFCARNLTIATAKPHDEEHGENNREVKWNANIQPVSKKRTSDSCKEIYSTGSAENIQLFKKESS